MNGEEESMAFDEETEHAICREQDVVRDFGEFSQAVPPVVEDWLRSAWCGSSGSLEPKHMRRGKKYKSTGSDFMDRLIPSGLVHKIDTLQQALGSRIIGQDEVPARS